jgi:hypothetical protein
MTNKLPPLPQGYGSIPWDYRGNIFIEAQIRAYGQQCRDAALDEAAQFCDERANGENDAQWCADAIRSLK